MEKMTQYIGLFITGLLTVTGIVVDNGLRWRSEMEYREYDRQTRLLENIMEVQAVSERTALINFYLSLGAFSSPIKESMESYLEANKVAVTNQPPRSVIPKRTEIRLEPEQTIDVFNNTELSNGLRSIRQNELPMED